MKREFTKEDTLLVKGMAVLCLLFYHLFEHHERVSVMQVDYRPFSIDIFLLLSGFGNICVAVFAFLSAYGIIKGIMAAEEKAGMQAPIQALYKQAVGRYLKLTAHFIAMFISVNVLWFYKFNYVGLYGSGWQELLYALLDALGLAGTYKTPTINQTWWYMELAILIIFLTPLLDYAAKKMGNYIILLGILLPVTLTLNPDVKRYYFVVLFGVAAARGSWFEKLFSIKISGAVQGVCGMLLLAVCVVVRQNYVVYHEFGYLVDAPVALAFSWFGAGVLSRLAGIREALCYLGRHSMNIYFVHTFFYIAIYQEFIYSFRYAGLIFAVLLICSLAYSMVLEGVKKRVGFNRLLAWIGRMF